IRGGRSWARSRWLWARGSWVWSSAWGSPSCDGIPDMRWSSPHLAWLLWGVPALALLVFWGARARRRSERVLGEPRALRALSGESGPGARLLRAILTLAAVAAAVVGLMRPQAGFRLVTTTSQGVDLVLALDLSRS